MKTPGYLVSMPAPFTGLPAHQWRIGDDKSPAATRPRIEVAWARHLDDVRRAQKLRFDVFAGELGAHIVTPLPGHDIDRFDDYCEHLLVREASSGDVVGTYRVLTPAQAARAGGSYADQEFDLAPLTFLRPRMVELGRSCVHPAHRNGRVIMALWTALGQFMARNALDTMIGCASVPLCQESADDVLAAAGIWNRVRTSHLAAAAYRVQPHVALPLPPERMLASLDTDPPALITGYLRLGARVLGPPAWDPAFRSADLPLLMRMDDLHRHYRQIPPGP